MKTKIMRLSTEVYWIELVYAIERIIHRDLISSPEAFCPYDAERLIVAGQTIKRVLDTRRGGKP